MCFYDLRFFSETVAQNSAKLSSFVACDDGKYGLKCNNTCGHCLDGDPCNNDNGTCMRGCSAGYKSDMLCQTGNYIDCDLKLSLFSFKIQNKSLL